MLRQNCKVATTAAPVAPIGVKNRVVAARAEAGVVHVRDAARAQPGGDVRGDVDVGLGLVPRDELRGELPGDFLPHLETADADARAEPRGNVCHPERERGAWWRGWRAARPPRPLAHARGD